MYVSWRHVMIFVKSSSLKVKSMNSSFIKNMNMKNMNFITFINLNIIKAKFEKGKISGLGEFISLPSFELQLWL